MTSWTRPLLIAIIAVLAVGTAYFYSEGQSLQTQNANLASTVSSLQTQVTSLQTALASLGGHQAPGTTIANNMVVMEANVSNGYFVIYVTNWTLYPIAVIQVSFNGSSVTNSSIIPYSGFTASGDGLVLPPGTSGELLIAVANLGVPISGTTYPFSVTTATPSNVTMP